jgi:nucleoside-diphosphate-sugar epimerase
MGIVLVTGSAGAVGQPVCSELVARGRRVRGLDRVPTPGLADAVVADVADAEAVRAACRDVDAVVHLAAKPDDAPFAELVGPNVTGVFNVLAAAREARVRRVVLASTLQVIWERASPDRDRPLGPDEASPANHYALTKLWAEQMGEMYARCYDMSVVALRITWMVRNAAEARKMRALRRFDIYVSQRDTARAFAAAVEAPAIRFAVAYVSGPDGGAQYDLEPGRRLLGWEPRDRWPEGAPREANEETIVRSEDHAEEL